MASERSLLGPADVPSALRLGRFADVLKKQSFSPKPVSRRPRERTQPRVDSVDGPLKVGSWPPRVGDKVWFQKVPHTPWVRCTVIKENVTSKKIQVDAKIGTWLGETEQREMLRLDQFVESISHDQATSPASSSSSSSWTEKRPQRGQRRGEEDSSESEASTSSSSSGSSDKQSAGLPAACQSLLDVRKVTVQQHRLQQLWQPQYADIQERLKRLQRSAKVNPDAQGPAIAERQDLIAVLQTLEKNLLRLGAALEEQSRVDVENSQLLGHVWLLLADVERYRAKAASSDAAREQALCRAEARYWRALEESAELGRARNLLGIMAFDRGDVFGGTLHALQAMIAAVPFDTSKSLVLSLEHAGGLDAAEDVEQLLEESAVDVKQCKDLLQRCFCVLHSNLMNQVALRKTKALVEALVAHLRWFFRALLPQAAGVVTGEEISAGAILAQEKGDRLGALSLRLVSASFCAVLHHAGGNVARPRPVAEAALLALGPAVTGVVLTESPPVAGAWQWFLALVSALAGLVGGPDSPMWAAVVLAACLCRHLGAWEDQATGGLRSELRGLMRRWKPLVALQDGEQKGDLLRVRLPEDGLLLGLLPTPLRLLGVDSWGNRGGKPGKEIVGSEEPKMHSARQSAVRRARLRACLASEADPSSADASTEAKATAARSTASAGPGVERTEGWSASAAPEVAFADTRMETEAQTRRPTPQACLVLALKPVILSGRPRQHPGSRWLRKKRQPIRSGRECRAW